MTPTDPYREWDAAYVLGALGPADRHAFEEHLATCADCRAAVAELAGVPGLLRGVAPEDVVAADLPAVAPGEGDVVPLDRLVRAARRSRARRRSLAAVAAVALVLGGTAAGLAWGGAFDGDPGPVPAAGSGPAEGTRTVDLAPQGVADVTATLTATPRAWGTSLSWTCTYPSATATGDGRYDPGPAGGPAVYELVLVDRDGGRTVAATWTASGPASAGLAAASAVPLADVARVEIGLAGSADALAAATL
ncbi:anti-sigma factor [Isoptericola sp. BMS4]|uniref:anti-sigma factor family protein n=1 Tax=Isoptericola sp. BMS4 TaxID=2527875 RepID=UPI00141F325D|nr:zf-HC2 domain-containing protein [Isoptericola sp. BMS4]